MLSKKTKKHKNKLQTYCTQLCALTYAAHPTLLHLLKTRRHDASVARYTVNIKAATVQGC